MSLEARQPLATPFLAFVNMVSNEAALCAMEWFQGCTELAEEGAQGLGVEWSMSMQGLAI